MQLQGGLITLCKKKWLKEQTSNSILQYMGTINLVGSLRYDMTGRKRKTKSLKTKSKRTIYNELIATQQRQYDNVVKRVAEEYPSFVSNNLTGAITPKVEPMQYTGCLLYTSPSPRD